MAYISIANMTILFLFFASILVVADEVGLSDVSTTQYTINWQLDNSNADYQLYWMRQLSSFPISYSASNIASGASQECVGSVGQSASGSLTITCPSAIGTGYTIWLLVATNDAGSQGDIYQMQYAMSSTLPSQAPETTTTQSSTVQWTYQYNFPSVFSAQMATSSEYFEHWINVFLAALSNVNPSSTLTASDLDLSVSSSVITAYSFQYTLPGQYAPDVASSEFTTAYQNALTSNTALYNVVSSTTTYTSIWSGTDVDVLSYYQDAWIEAYMQALNGVGLNFDFDASDFGVLMQGVGDNVYILFTNRGYLTPYTNTGEFDTEFRSQVASDYSLAQATEGYRVEYGLNQFRSLSQAELFYKFYKNDPTKQVVLYYYLQPADDDSVPSVNDIINAANDNAVGAGSAPNNGQGRTLVTIPLTSNFFNGGDPKLFVFVTVVNDGDNTVNYGWLTPSSGEAVSPDTSLYQSGYPLPQMGNVGFITNDGVDTFYTVDPSTSQGAFDFVYGVANPLQNSNVYMVLSPASQPALPVNTLVSIANTGINGANYCVLVFPQSADFAYFQLGSSCTMLTPGQNFRMQFAVDRVGGYILMPETVVSYTTVDSGAPTVESVTVGTDNTLVTGDPFSFTMDFSNPISGGSVYWVVRPSGSDAPTSDEYVTGEGSTVSGVVPQSSGTIPVTTNAPIPFDQNNGVPNTYVLYFTYTTPTGTVFGSQPFNVRGYEVTVNVLGLLPGILQLNDETFTSYCGVKSFFNSQSGSNTQSWTDEIWCNSNIPDGTSKTFSVINLSNGQNIIWSVPSFTDQGTPLTSNVDDGRLTVDVTGDVTITVILTSGTTTTIATTTTPATTTTIGTTVFSFSVPNTSVGDLIRYYNNFVTSLSDVTGIPTSLLFPQFTQDGTTVVITFNIPGDYTTTINNPTVTTNYFNTLATVPGLNDELGLTTTFPYTLPNVSPDDVPQDDIDNMVNTLADMLGVDPDTITYTLTPDGDDTTVTFTIPENTTVVVDPNTGNVIYNVNEPSNDSTVTDPSFPTTFWTTVTSQNPDMATRYPSEEATTPTPEETTTGAGEDTTQTPETTDSTTDGSEQTSQTPAESTDSSEGTTQEPEITVSTTDDSEETTQEPETTVSTTDDSEGTTQEPETSVSTTDGSQDTTQAPETTGSVSPDECADGQVIVTRTYPACFSTTSSTQYDLAEGEELSVLSIPVGMNNFRVDTNAQGDVNLKLIDAADGTCIIGGPECQLQSDGTYEGMAVRWSGDDTTNPVEEFIEVSLVTKTLTLNLLAVQDANGVLQQSWNGIQPCGAVEECASVPTATPTFATTTTKEPTSSPTDSPTNSPSNEPTSSPSDSPTEVTCPDGFESYVRTYSACFATTSQTQTDLAANVEQTILFIPVGAQDFETTFTFDGPGSYLYLYDENDVEFVGGPGQSDVTFNYNGVEFTYSTSGNTQTISSPLISMGTYIVIKAGSNGVDGTVSSSWNGVSPCGDVTECREVVTTATPTRDPSKAPTPLECPDGLRLYTRQYPACFNTESTTGFDLDVGAFQTVLYVPVGAQDFQVQLEADSTTYLQWFDSTDLATPIVGGPTARYHEAGTFTYEGMEFTTSGDDNTGATSTSLSVPLVSQGTFVVIRSVNSQSRGSISLSWNGVSPCGAVEECGFAPSSMPSVSPVTSSPTSPPTRRPTPSPTPSPTNRPTFSPTNLETEPPTSAPTCPDGFSSQFRTLPVCFRTSGSTSFDLMAGASLAVIAPPLNAKEFESIMTSTGDADLQLWTVDELGNAQCVVGSTANCQYTSSVNYNGMRVIFSGEAPTETFNIESVSVFSSLVVRAITDTVGQVTHTWNGVEPCGGFEVTCIPPPTNDPTESPTTPEPTPPPAPAPTAVSNAPTTSPTSAPTSMPTLQPTVPITLRPTRAPTRLECESSEVQQFVAQNPCFPTSGQTSFDLVAGESLNVLNSPVGARDLETELTFYDGTVDLQLWTIGDNAEAAYCFLGLSDDCLMHSSGVFNNMRFEYNGRRVYVPVQEFFMAIRLQSLRSTGTSTGVITHEWTSVSNCGDGSFICVPKPTMSPTPSVPTNLPTTSPTSQPTTQPTNSPSRDPTPAPTNLPTSSPTPRPSEAPTGFTCSDPNMEIVTEIYSSCFSTSSNVNFNLQPFGTQILMSIPLNAQDFSSSMTADNDVDLQWIDASTVTTDIFQGTVIVGSDSPAGTNLYSDMTISYTGDDTTAPVTETISSPVVSVPTYAVLRAGASPVSGQVNMQWSGIFPCGIVRSCRHVPSSAPSTSPTSGPTTSPTVAPSNPPTDSPTSGPTASPSDAPTTCPEGSTRIFRTLPACFQTSGTNTFDLSAGESLSVLTLPVNANEFTARLTMSSGDADLQLWNVDASSNSVCYAGTAGVCQLSESGDFNGMQVEMSGTSNGGIEFYFIGTVEQFTAMRVQANTDAVGSVTYSWNGISPCGGQEGFCQDAPTVQPTTSPTSGPTTSPSPNPTPAPSYEPTESPMVSQPTLNPTTTIPSGRPTTSPTSGPTTSPTGIPTTQPTQMPTGAPTCPEGTTLQFRTLPACFQTADSGSTTFDLTGGEELSVVGVPSNAKELTASMSQASNTCSLELWVIDTAGARCAFGQRPGCEQSSSGTLDGLAVTYSSRTIFMQVGYSGVSAVSVYCSDDSTGTVLHSWNGVSPCGDDGAYCMEQPTGNPTTSPTSGPTTSPTQSPTNNPAISEPTPSPTDSPTNSPDTSEPSDRPTTSPTSGPTTSPTLSPTTHSCPEGQSGFIRTYPACFATESTTTFDLTDNTFQTIIYIPNQAQDFETEMDASDVASLILVDASTSVGALEDAIRIVGDEDSVITTAGSSNYNGMDLEYSGPGDNVRITIPIVTVSSAILIRSYAPVTGTVSTNWNGVFPCGEVIECTDRPTSNPSTTDPTGVPTTSPTSGPTTSPTLSPSNDPVTSRPTEEPTIAPTTPEPTRNPLPFTCPFEDMEIITEFYPACVGTSSTTSFDLGAGATQIIMSVPVDAQDLVSQMIAEGDVDLLMIDANTITSGIESGTIIVGGGENAFTGVSDGQVNSGFYNGMTVLTSGDDRSTPVQEYISTPRASVPTFLVVRSNSGTSRGQVSVTWSGIAPCGEVKVCRHLPTGQPTTSPTSGPTTSPSFEPTPRPTEDPTKSPMLSVPTGRPTTSPTSGPTTSPTLSPTVIDCEEGQTSFSRVYPACFATESTTTFDLDDNTFQTILFVPNQAQDFRATMDASAFASMILVDGNSAFGNLQEGIRIVGDEQSVITQPGNSEYEGMDIFWSGPGDEVTIEIPLVSVGSAIMIRSYEPATGTVSLNWNGVFPCGVVTECSDPPTRQPTTTRPTGRPTTSPTSGPTTSPTLIPTNDPVTSRPTEEPTSYPTTPEPTMNPLPFTCPFEDMEIIEEVYPACVGTSSSSTFDLAPGESQVVMSMPVDAQDFVSQLIAEGDVDLVLVDGTTVTSDVLSGTIIVGGGENSFTGVSEGQTNAGFYAGMTILTSGDDSTTPIQEYISATRLTIPTFLVVRAGDNAPRNRGQVSVSWTGIAPCGVVKTCRHVPTGVPTTSPTSGPTTSPSFQPTTSPSNEPTTAPTCAEGTTLQFRTLPACFLTTGTSTFDLDVDASLSIVGMPSNAKDFVAQMNGDNGNGQLEMWVTDLGAPFCLFGMRPQCVNSEDATWNGLEVEYSRTEMKMPLGYSGAASLRVYAEDATEGSVSYSWNGVFPCGDDGAYCMEEPTNMPTTSPTSGPTTSPSFEPTPRPTEEPTKSPEISVPTDAPTTSPSSQPTTSPTLAPTTCYGDSEPSTVQYPPCFQTTSTSTVDLAPNAEQVILFIPTNAQDFVATMPSSMDAELVWYESSRDIAIVGTTTAELQFSGGIYTGTNGQNMVVEYSDDGRRILISTPQATVGSFVRVIAGSSGAQGTIDLSWNGIVPCGAVTVCTTVAPTTSPTTGPTPEPTPMPSDSPTTGSRSPSGSPSDSPTPSPTNAPTTSPISEPTPSPTLSPTLSPTCAEGTTTRIRTQPACFQTAGTSTWDLQANEPLDILGVPVGAKEVFVQMTSTSGSANLELWNVDTNSCIRGRSSYCADNEEVNGMTIDFQVSGTVQTIRIDPSTTDVLEYRVVAITDSVGRVTHSWNGIEPCGDDIVTCEEAPTVRPTTSPTSGPTTSPTYTPTNSPDTSRPTPPPTQSPTDNPAISQPTDRPTTSPTSGPTTEPSNAPTACADPLTRVCDNYSACFTTNSATDFDLAPFATQTVIFIPLNAQDFTAELISENDADMVWYASDTISAGEPEGVAIVGSENSIITDTEGTYEGMDITFTGQDYDSPVREAISSPLVTVGTFIRVTAGAQGAVGSVTSSWNGQFPCGEVCYCQMPPTLNPTTSNPSDRPTTSPTSGPTPMPTPSPTNSPSPMPTDNPAISEPSNRPTTSPTSGPTTSPTLSPTDCMPGMIQYVRTYPACFETSSTTSFDLDAGVDQTIIFVPLNAQDFVAELNSDNQATMILLDGSTFTGNVEDSTVIVGPEDAFVTTPGESNYEGMDFYWTGRDLTNPVTERIESPVMSVGTILLVRSFEDGAVGTVSLSWNGVAPCGTVTECAEAPTLNPTTSVPTGLPTTSPTSGPTTSPTLVPSNQPTESPTSRPTTAPSDAPTPCPEGTTRLFRVLPACFGTSGSSTFDLTAGETLSILALPIDAQDFVSRLTVDTGDADIQLFTVDTQTGQAPCYLGTPGDCIMSESGVYEGMPVTFTGTAFGRPEEVRIPIVSIFTAIRVVANTDTTGRITHSWEGISPCGGQEDSCQPFPTMDPTTTQPTDAPTTSPSSRPTTSPSFEPTESPTTAPTRNPVPSVPTFAPTTSPSSRPTTSPSMAPTPRPTSAPTQDPVFSTPTFAPTTSPSSQPTTSPTIAPTECVEPMEPYTISYSACFETQSTTTFDLQAGEDQTIIFVPLNAQDFVAELNTDFRATMILLDGNTYTGNVDDALVIVGTDDAAITQPGNVRYQDMTFYWSGQDFTPPTYQRLESEQMTVGSILVVRSFENDATGSVTLRWNGVAPCGTVTLCAMPPTPAPTDSPTQDPVSSVPTFRPTTSPTSGPTPTPTESPTNDPVVSAPSFRPTTSPTSGPTTSPTMDPVTTRPTRAPTPCQEGFTRFVRVQPACFGTSGSQSFDLTAGESLSVLALPQNAKNFEAVLRMTTGNANLQLWTLTGSDTGCYLGDIDEGCLSDESGPYEDMTITYSGPVPFGTESVSIPVASTFTALRVQAVTDTTGSISYVWEGVSPCGEIEEYCAPPPTENPTTSPTSGPTTSPTLAPTECEEPSFMVCEEFPPCFATNSQTTFDLQEGEDMTVIFVPVNAVDFETTISSNGDANVVLVDSTTVTPQNADGVSIIGEPSAVLDTFGNYRGMDVEFDGTTISSPLVSVSVIVVVKNAGTDDVTGTVSSSWNGIQPCGDVCQCATNPPTNVPTLDPVTSTPSNRPTTSPTTGPTNEPSPSPTVAPTDAPTRAPTECPEGMLSSITQYSACFETTSTTDFDLAPFATQTVIYVPLRARDFVSTMQTDNDANMMWYDADTMSSGEPTGTVIVGSPGSAITGRGSDTDYRGMTVTFSGQDPTSPVNERIESPEVTIGTFVRVTAGADGAVGTVVLSWNGQAPCGTEVLCIMPPTENPTTSPTTGPTREPTPAPSTRPTESPTADPVTSRPTDRPTTSPTTGPTRDPTPSPTDNPTISQPTNRPTTSPTSGPTTSPTMAPTDCEPPMTRVTEVYSACFAIESQTDFDLAPGGTQTVLFIPLNAQDFVATLRANDDVDMVWIDSNSITFDNPNGIEIIGSPTSEITDSVGTYDGMTVFFSGQDTNPQGGVTEEISSPLVSTGSFIRVIAGDNGAVGTISVSWDGQAPCGTLEYCQMPPTDAPTTSPSSRPTSSPTVAPTRDPTISQPTPAPTESPTDNPVTSIPTNRPTTSPTSGPTTSPTPQPTQSPTCAEGQTRMVRAEPACFATTGSTNFDLATGEFLPVVGVPENAKEFESVMRATQGDCDLQLWGVDSSTNQFVCFFGSASDCRYPSSTSYLGMDVTFTGDDTTVPIVEELSIPLTTIATQLRIAADGSRCIGTVTHRWNGVEPCGRVETYCQEPPTPSPTESPTDNPVTSRPTDRPTTSPTTGPTREPTPSPTDNPTVSQPTPRPTESPTADPVTSRPTDRPTTSPTTGPTREPTPSPTVSPTVNPSRSPTPCEPPMTRREISYPACFLTRSSTSFDLAPSATQTVIFIPQNAQNVVAEVEAGSDVDLELVDSQSISSVNPDGTVIVGSPRALSNTRGTYVYQGMTVEFSGQDFSSPYTESITSEVMSVNTFLRVVAGPTGAVGSVTVSWNGVQPCGTVEYCEMPPTLNPTTSPTSGPTTSPTNDPTPHECPEDMIMITEEYPRCFSTDSTSSFTLDPFAVQTLLVVPDSALDFEISIQTDVDATLALISSEDNSVIIGTSFAILGKEDGVFGDTQLYYDEDSDEIKLSSPRVNDPIYVSVTAGSSGAQGVVRFSWRGIYPCGTVKTCIDQPTVRPTTSPSTGPSPAPTPSPTNPPTSDPTPSPTNPPTSEPTLNPTSSRPTFGPTTSPTSGPTTSPTLDPTQSPTCAEGMLTITRNQPSCFATSGTSTFDIERGEYFPVIGIPNNAKEFTVELQATGGNCDLQVYGPDDNLGIACIVGASDECIYKTSATYEGMDIEFSGPDDTAPVYESIYIELATTFSAIRVYANDDCQGTVSHRWTGIDPCGDPIVECRHPPTSDPSPAPTASTATPTTSPTTNPSPQPTPSPTDAPTVTPPSNEPSKAPTCYEECTDFVPEGQSMWYDNFGDFFTCDYYAQAPTELCTQTGDMFSNFGKTAREACCACNGNHDCGRVCDVVVMFKTCSGANSTTEAWPSATICDRSGNCQDNYYLDPVEDILWANPLWPILAGTKYAWRVPTSMFDSYASTITLTSAQDGVCIEDVWIDYALVNDPSEPIFLAPDNTDEFPGEETVSTVTFGAPDCRQPSQSPSMTPTPAPTSAPTDAPSESPLSCVEMRGQYSVKVEEYNQKEEQCQNTQDAYTALAQSNGCDYGVTCARCDRMTADEPASSPELDEAETFFIGQFYPGQVDEERLPSGQIIFLSPTTRQIYVIANGRYRRTCIQYKPNANQYCTGNDLHDDLYCAGGERIGTVEEVDAAVSLALSQNDFIHPECPSSCKGLTDTVAEHFEKMGVENYDQVCTYNGLYFYKDPSTNSRKFTCVAAGERLDECPADEYLCVGFDDNTGRKTYGFYDWQAAAVKTAISLESKIHPYCPAYADV